MVIHLVVLGLDVAARVEVDLRERGRADALEEAPEEVQAGKDGELDCARS